MPETLLAATVKTNPQGRLSRIQMATLGKQIGAAFQWVELVALTPVNCWKLPLAEAG